MKLYPAWLTRPPEGNTSEVGTRSLSPSPCCWWEGVVGVEVGMEVVPEVFIGEGTAELFFDSWESSGPTEALAGCCVAELVADSSFSARDEDDDFAEGGFSDLEVEFGLVAFCWVIGLVPVEGVVGEDEVTGLLLLLPLPIFNCQNKHKE